MKKLGADIKGFGLLLMGVIVMLCSCHDDSYPVPSSETEGMRRNLVISLTVQQPGLQSPTSRAPFDTGYELGFTEKECQIHTLTLIMMGIDNNENELPETWQTIEPSEPTNGIYDVQFTLSGITGTKHFYILANAEQKHINAFWAKDRIFDAGEGQSGHNIVGNLMEINHNENGDGEGSNILMAGIVKSNSGDRDIVIPTGDGNEETVEKITIDTPINLVRTVAKILLTCVPKSDAETDYVKVIDRKDAETNPEGDGENTGWIQLAYVNYMLNVLNRKTYMDYRTDEDGDAYLKDPNYEMSEWLEKKVSGDETTYGIKDLDAYQKEFLFYDTQDMVEMLNRSIPTYKGGEPCMVRTATLYDKNRIGKENATSPDHYTEGLYCTENTVYNDMTFANEADFQSAIRYVTTRVMVGAKYTPKVIWDGGEEPITTQTEEKAKEILDVVEDVDNPLEPVTYPAGTFWRDSDGNYYSLEGMKEKLKKSPETDFSRYDGGWGYYYTYIDENAQNGAISKDTQTRWGIKRNHYYILKVDKIIAPGSPFPGNETMRIHSELVDWVDKGGSEVEIKVPQQSETAQP